MTTLEESASGALFSIQGATPGLTQWRLTSLQLVNWGGFAGPWTIPFHRGTTLLSGPSGSGKSTILDAYTALMMEQRIAFNGASNDSGMGRARGGDQRSLLSYLRGQVDTEDDEDGLQRARVLRGTSQDTWGAVGATFASDTGAAFTCARVYYVATNARTDGDISQRLITIEAPLDLTELAPYSAEHFIPAKLRAHAPGLSTHNSYAEFAARLHSRLGIGANGDGDKALKLLARVQAGHQIRTVDSLYKELVLERPSTYAKADLALADFDNLADTHARMVDELERLAILEPIDDLHTRLQSALRTCDRLSSIGLNAGVRETPLTLWRLGHHRLLLAQAELANRSGLELLQTKLTESEARHASARAELEELQRAFNQAGGADIESLEREIDTRDAQLAQAERTAEGLNQSLTVVLVGRDLRDAATFRAVIDEGKTLEAEFPALQEELGRRAEAFRIPLSEAAGRIVDANNDMISLGSRSSRITDQMVQVKAQVAEATGIPVEDLAYVAELVDVPDEHQHWRVAAEASLGGWSQRLLVPAERFAQFSRGIDELRLRRLLRFKEAHLDHPVPPPAPADTVVGKLVFQDSRFRGWLAGFLSNPARNARCVERADELTGAAFEVTAAGQTRAPGGLGTHGNDNARPMLGFSNEDLRAQAKEALDTAKADYDAIKGKLEEIAEQRSALEGRRLAYVSVSNVPFALVDTHAIEVSLAELQGRLERLLAADGDLAVLRVELAASSDREDKLRGEAFAALRTLESHNETWGSLVDAGDGVSLQIENLTRGRDLEVTEDQQQWLDVVLAHSCKRLGVDGLQLEDWKAVWNTVESRLRELSQSAEDELARTTDGLERVFTKYHERFRPPNLGRRVASYPDYARVLQEVRDRGLAQQREQWRDQLVKWSGEDLVPLAQAMTSSITDIESRLLPVNAILSGLPFGPTRDRLKMNLRRVHRDSVAAFRKELNELSSGATGDLATEQLEDRFRRIERFMAQLRPASDPRYDPKRSVRDDVLDVRRQVQITARRLGPEQKVLSTYASLGSKSGGETQELVAFIVGAALRYRLGDEDRARPRFAPVLLDEGFIKADAQFSSRAVAAWVNLGFQLIVGAPEDKVSALEPHMDAFLAVTKNHADHLSRVRVVSDRERDHQRRQLPDVAAGTP